MGSLSNRQSILRPVSGRQAVAQLGLAQQPVPRPVSGRFMAAHLGVGRTRAVSTDVLARRLPAPVSPEIAQFYQLRAQALRLQQQLAAHDARAKAAHGLTPKEAGYPAPFLTPAEQARRRQEAKARAELQERLLAQANQQLKYCYLPSFLVPRLPENQQRALEATAPGADNFMPTTWWRSQNPTGSKEVGWKLCCATVKKMVGYNSPEKDRVQIVREHGRSLELQPSAAAGFAMLDRYMALRKPVMTGVNHSYAAGYNEGTTDHFVAIVGTGTDAKGKYYRFFDVGTRNANKDKGIDPRNRLYYDAGTGSYAGKSAVNDKTYTISQLRFKPGTF